MPPDDDYSYLNGLSDHPNRAGDTSNLNPQFASALAASLRQAQAAGLPVRLMSGFRTPGQTGTAYDASGKSSHSYGLASDIGGLDGPNGKITNQWAQIAQANGLHNPYGAGNKTEFNHWQLPEQPLETNQPLLTSLKSAAASGDFKNVWNAYSGSAPAPINSNLAASTPPLAGSHSQFISDYSKSIGLDQNLALGIGNAEGLKAWSAANPNAASRVDVQNGQPFSFGDFQLNTRNGLGVEALKAGIDPRDPDQWQAADRFALDKMKSGGVGPWKGDAYAANYLNTGSAPAVAPDAAPGIVDPSIVAHGGTSPPIPDTPGTSLTSSPASQIASKLFGGTGADGKGLSPVEKAAKDLGGDDKPPSLLPNDIGGQQAAMGQGMARQQMLASQGQQLAAAWQQKAMQPLSYGGGRPLSSSGLQDDRPMGETVQGGQAIPLPPGMTLNSMGSLYG